MPLKDQYWFGGVFCHNVRGRMRTGFDVLFAQTRMNCGIYIYMAFLISTRECYFLHFKGEYGVRC